MRSVKDTIRISMITALISAGCITQVVPASTLDAAPLATQIVNIENAYAENILVMDSIKATEIKDNGVTIGYEVRVKVNDTNLFDEMLFPTWTENDDQDDIVWGKGNIVGDEVVYNVMLSDHNNESGEYNTHIYIKDKNQNLQIATGFKVNIEKPSLVVKNITAKEIKSGDTTTGYEVRVDVNDVNLVDKSWFPTWTEKDDQDDIVWGEGTKEGNQLVFNVNIADHNNEAGIYNTHVYIQDKDGKFEFVGGIPFTVEDVTTKNIEVTNIDTELLGTKQNPTGYKIELTVTNPEAIDEVWFPTWTEKDEQDDVQWINGTVEEDGKITAQVNIADHNNEMGLYNTHVYVKDKAGNFKILAGIPFTVENINMDNLEILNLEKVDSETGYKLELTVNNAELFDEILFPTWTEKDDQDDIEWLTGMVEDDGKITVNIDKANHNNETGVYLTHFYAKDSAGNLKLLGGTDMTIADTEIVEDVETPKLEVSDIFVYSIVADLDDVPTQRGVQISINDKSYLEGKEVVVPIWTEKDGQDDIEWITADIDPSGNSVSFVFDIADHNSETGDYNMHIYTKDIATGELTYIDKKIVNVE